MVAREETHLVQASSTISVYIADVLLDAFEDLAPRSSIERCGDYNKTEDTVAVSVILSANVDLAHLRDSLFREFGLSVEISTSWRGEHTITVQNCSELWNEFVIDQAKHTKSTPRWLDMFGSQSSRLIKAGFLILSLIIVLLIVCLYSLEEALELQNHYETYYDTGHYSTTPDYFFIFIAAWKKILFLQ